MYLSVFGSSAVEVADRVRSGDAGVGVVGLGLMGLSVAALYADSGAAVIGSDIDLRLVDRINKGECPLPEPGLDVMLRRSVKNGRLRAVSDSTELASASDCIFVTVPTLIDRNRRPDYSALEHASTEIAKGLQPNSLVVTQSTCGPTVNDRVVKPLLEKFSGLKAGEGFGLAHSPIRAMAGRVLEDLQNYNRIIGAVDAKSLESCYGLLSVIVKGQLIRVSNLHTAEASKLFEAIYRDVNIALASEFAKICEALAIDFVEARNAANSQPYSNIHVPGIGVGGHCLPIYPHLLCEELRNTAINPRIILDARKVNDSMPTHVARLVADALRACGRLLRRSKVAVLGITYRPNVKETRYSPAIELVTQLRKRGAKVSVFDPVVPPKDLEKIGVPAEASLRKAVEKADCVVLAVAHNDFRQLATIELAAHMSRPSAVVDCTHTIQPDQVEKAGLVYRGVGRAIWSR